MKVSLSQAFRYSLMPLFAYCSKKRGGTQGMTRGSAAVAGVRLLEKLLRLLPGSLVGPLTLSSV
jgi:hypothetical protein